MRRPVETVAEGRGHSQRFGDEGHHVVDLADDARADFIDALSGADLGKIGFVNLIEIGLSQLAVAGKRLIDDLVQGTVVARRIDVPDLVIARHCCLAQGSNLTQSNLSERHGAFMLFQKANHVLCPQGCLIASLTHR